MGESSIQTVYLLWLYTCCGYPGKIARNPISESEHEMTGTTDSLARSLNFLLPLVLLVKPPEVLYCSVYTQLFWNHYRVSSMPSESQHLECSFLLLLCGHSQYVGYCLGIRSRSFKKSKSRIEFTMWRGMHRTLKFALLCYAYALKRTYISQEKHWQANTKGEGKDDMERIYLKMKRWQIFTSLTVVLSLSCWAQPAL